MKKIYTIAILLILITASSCQATPEDKIVVSKGQEQVDEIIADASENDIDALQPLQYETPQNVIETYEGTSHYGAKIHITLDAEVSLPEYTIPLTIVKPQNLAFEQIDSLIDFFCGDDLLYYSQFREIADTKNKIQNEIDLHLWEINQMKDDIEMKALVDYRQSEVQELYKKMSSAPDDYAAAAELIITDEELQNKINERYDKNYTEEDFIKMTSPVVITEENYTESFGTLYVGELGFEPSITIIQNSDWSGAKFVYDSNIPINSEEWNIYASIGRRDMILQDDLLITLEQADGIARKYVDLIDSTFKMCDSGVLIDKDYTTNIETAVGYELIYSRVYNGVANNFYVERLIKASGDKDGSYDTMFKLPYTQEEIIIRIDDAGDIMKFSYTSPMEVVEVVSNEVDLLPFEDVMDIFEKYIMMINLNEAFTDIYLDINEIKLGMMRIDMPNSDEFMVVPVWDFYGCVTYKSSYTYEDGQTFTEDSTESRANEFMSGTTFLTINAIDGSIINREQGY